MCSITRITCGVLVMSVFLKSFVIVGVSSINCSELHESGVWYEISQLLCNDFLVGMTGIVDYTNYDDMKYAVS